MNNQLPNRCFPLKSPGRIYDILRNRQKEVTRVSMSLDRSIERKDSIIHRPIKNRVVRSNPKRDSYPSLTLIRGKKSLTTKQSGHGESNQSIDASNSKFTKASSKQYFLKKLRERPRCFDMSCLEGSKFRKEMETLQPIELKTKVLENKPFCTLSSEQTIIKHSNKLSTFEKSEIKYYDCIYYHGEGVDKTREGKANWGFDDSEGSYLFKLHDHLAYRYQILEKLGEGSFGQVLRCLDHKTQKQVAIKMVKNRKRYTSQALIEIGILETVKLAGEGNNRHIVEILDSFIFRQHQCMVFELLSINLYELLKLNNYEGIPEDLIRRFALQILTGVAVLHMNGIIHCDIKPENIVLKHAQKSGLKIIDFGSSCKFHEKIYTYLQSRYYRAPEVIMGIGYNQKIDIWSLGCVFAELLLGYPIFPGRDEKGQINIIIEILGPPSKAFRDKCSMINPFLFQSLPPTKSSFDTIIPNKDFNQFIRKCLQWNPSQRASIFQLVGDPWIIKGLPADVKVQHQLYIKQLRPPHKNGHNSSRFRNKQ